MRRRYLKAFARARERIHVAHGYFLPDRRVIRAITAAARRGVQVRLLLAGRSDVLFARMATRSLYRRLLAAGVEIHEWSGSVLHAKVATVDGQCLLVGSFNLDPFSLANLEALVEVTDPRIVEQGEAWIQHHFVVSRSITTTAVSSRLSRWLLDPLGGLVARLADVSSRAIAGRRQRQAFRLARKVGVAVAGFSVVGFGVALIVLPGPALLVIPLGLGILATEFLWARRLVDPIRKLLQRLKVRAWRMLVGVRPQ